MLLIAMLLSFEDVTKEAISSKKPVVVFRNCEVIAGPWISWSPKPDKDREPLIIVNVVRDGKLVFRAHVTPGIGAEQVIYNVLMINHQK